MQKSKIVKLFFPNKYKKENIFSNLAFQIKSKIRTFARRCQNEHEKFIYEPKYHKFGKGINYSISTILIMTMKVKATNYK